MRVLLTSFLTPGTFRLFYVTLWGLLGAPNCDHPSKIERGGVLWPLTAAIQTIHTTTNQKIVSVVGGYQGGCVTAENCEGRELP
jgi:hypothetical protein